MMRRSWATFITICLVIDSSRYCADALERRSLIGRGTGQIIEEIADFLEPSTCPMILDECKNSKELVDFGKFRSDTIEPTFFIGVLDILFDMLYLSMEDKGYPEFGLPGTSSIENIATSLEAVSKDLGGEVEVKIASQKGAFDPKALAPMIDWVAVLRLSIRLLRASLGRIMNQQDDEDDSDAASIDVTFKNGVARLDVEMSGLVSDIRGLKNFIESGGKVNGDSVILTMFISNLISLGVLMLRGMIMVYLKDLKSAGAGFIFYAIFSFLTNVDADSDSGVNPSSANGSPGGLRNMSNVYNNESDPIAANQNFIQSDEVLYILSLIGSLTRSIEGSDLHEDLKCQLELSVCERW